jgi:hypothetical protein
MVQRVFTRNTNLSFIQPHFVKCDTNRPFKLCCSTKCHVARHEIRVSYKQTFNWLENAPRLRSSKNANVCSLSLLRLWEVAWKETIATWALSYSSFLLVQGRATFNPAAPLLRLLPANWNNKNAYLNSREGKKRFWKQVGMRSEADCRKRQTNSLQCHVGSALPASWSRFQAGINWCMYINNS